MTSRRRLFLCADCGGTKTAVVLVDESGNVVARGSGGPSNFMDVGMTAFVRAVRTAVEAALADVLGSKTTLPSSSPLLTAAWFGISGCDRPADIYALQPVLSTLLSIPLAQLIIANDTHLLASPLSSHPRAKSAVVVIAGTGSNCVSFKRREGGEGGLVELARSGGWGWILGDEGSGFFVGRTAVRFILAQWDRESLFTTSSGPAVDIAEEINPETGKPSLRARIFGHFGISSPPDLFSVVYTADPPPLHTSGDTSSNVPPASPGPVTAEVPTTPSITVDASVVDGVTGTSNLVPPLSLESALAPPGPTGSPSPAPNTNIHLLERKHRLTSLTPLIFSSAFDDGDLDALRVLRTCARALAEHIDLLMVRSGDKNPATGSKAVRPEETLLCFGGSLVGIKKYRALVVDELGRLRKGLGVGAGEAEAVGEGEDAEGRGVVAGVVFVKDAAVSGAVGLASGFAG